MEQQQENHPSLAPKTARLEVNLGGLIQGAVLEAVHLKAIPPATLTVEADERRGLTITARVAPPASALAPDNLLRVTGSVGDGVLRIQDPAPPIGSLSPDHKLDVQPEPDHGFLFWMTHD